MAAKKKSGAKNQPKTKPVVAGVVRRQVAAPPAEASFRQRLVRLLRQRGQGGVDPAQLAEVKAGVMEELRRQNSGLKGEPFGEVLLPPRRAPRWEDGHWRLTLGILVLAALAAGGIAWWMARAAHGTLTPPLTVAEIAPAAAPEEAPALARFVAVDVLQAAKDADGRVLARVNVQNLAPVQLHGLDFDLVIGDADGRPLKTVPLHEAGPWAPGTNAEKTYTVNFDRADPREAALADLPLNALTVGAVAHGVAEADGTVIGGE
jgi:hypothetical protein